MVRKENISQISLNKIVLVSRELFTDAGKRQIIILDFQFLNTSKAKPRL
jgi:hypothetical protein